MNPPISPQSPRGSTVAGLGEAGILGILTRRFETVPAAHDWPQGTVGPGDDAAVVAAPDGRFVISTDAMAQDRDFRLHWAAGPRGYRGDGFHGGHSTGWKAAAQNLSDVNAMGAEPTGLLLALTMPPGTPADWVDGLAAGIAGAVRHLGAVRCRIVGGDLGADDRITLAVTAMGDLGGRMPLTRRSAGDRTDGVRAEREDAGLDLVLCGRAGWAAAGLAVLDTPRAPLLRAAGAAPAADRIGRLLALTAAAQLRPRPVLGAGRTALEAGALAGMDVSDGLLKDAGRLAAANGLRAELDPGWIQGRAAALLPLARCLPAAADGRTPRELAEHWVRTGGEDYGLLAAVPTGGGVPAGFERIGRLVPVSAPDPAAAPDPATARDHGRRPVTADGWDHFTA